MIKLKTPGQLFAQAYIAVHTKPKPEDRWDYYSRVRCMSTHTPKSGVSTLTAEDFGVQENHLADLVPAEPLLEEPERSIGFVRRTRDGSEPANGPSELSPVQGKLGA